jgi:dTDP-L-rhamnose 4-epimerase
VKVLVTGGAGLIGSHIVDMLLEKGYEVKILDNLERPTHLKGKPPWIPKEAEFILGDMRNEKDVDKALEGVKIVFHQAATGGFSDEIARYVHANSLGTAIMLELIKEKHKNVEKIIVASSQAVYGEGKYTCDTCKEVKFPSARPIEQLLNKEWEWYCSHCKGKLKPIPTDEESYIGGELVYSITKYDQERLVMSFGKMHKIPTVALRYFVTYGPRQSLFNPYTGVCSIFSTRILNNLPPIIYEDGLQTRDFVYVEDVARANILVAEDKKADYQVFNVGTGKPTSILTFAKVLIKKYGYDLEPEIKGTFRIGDTRHLFADISKIKKLGFKPSFSLEEGFERYISWIKEQGDVKEYFSEAERLLKEKGHIKS